ncbi:MAG TPA: DUF1501 domain-containing protein [Gemmatimonadaceae bacterium]|nr:DUF1501 domain-containing protein [Gemmatimonadaceae bacterium]
MQRRLFVRSGAVALVTLGLSPRFLRRTAFAAELVRAARGKTLICLFQRGAADALNVVVPHGEGVYYQLRPTIAVPRPSSRADGAAIDLDGFFGLHPALAPLEPLWKRGMLAAVHAVGSPDSTRSHFDAQDYMETATPGVKGTRDGWINRYLSNTAPRNLPGMREPAPQDSSSASALPESAASTAFRAVALGARTPRIFDGPAPTVAMNAIEEFSIRAADGAAIDRLEALYRTGSADLIHASGSEMFEAMRMLRAADPRQYAPASGASYPRSQFGQRLLQIAQLIKADIGLEVAFADVGGWDTHVNQGGASGQLANRLSDFARSIAALVTDLGDRMDDVVILTMSEFGRMARENGNRGTDHGHAGALFVLGGRVNGGKVYGRWPGLEREQLFEGRDLALTTDFRAVFAEIASRHLGSARLDAIFPGFTVGEPEWLGVL